MEDIPQKISVGKLEWGVIIAVMLSLSSSVFSAGILWSRVENHEQRLVKQEVRTESVGERLAGIESKLDFLVAQYRDERSRE